MINIDSLCAPVDESQPAGPDLEYDPAFLALNVALEGKPERQYGDTLIPAEPPDWKNVLEQAQALALRSKDLRVASIIARALTRLDGLGGLVQGLQLVDQLCRRYWEHVHPQLDASDGNDPTLRMNALAPLGDPDALLRDIRHAVIASARGMGSCTVRELEIALGILSPVTDDAASGMTTGDIDAVVRSAQAEGSLHGNHALEAITLAKGLSAYLNEQVGSAQAVDLQPLVARLRPVADHVASLLPQETAAAETAAVAGEAAAPPRDMPAAAQPAGIPVNTEVRSRQDAARLLDLVCAYFEKNEPTNPAPLLLRRAQRLATMNFYDIVRDIAPDAISAVDTVAGIRE